MEGNGVVVLVLVVDAKFDFTHVDILGAVSIKQSFRSMQTPSLLKLCELYSSILPFETPVFNPAPPLPPLQQVSEQGLFLFGIILQVRPSGA